MEQETQQSQNSGQLPSDSERLKSQSLRQKKSGSGKNKEKHFQEKISIDGSEKTLEERTSSLENENESSSLGKQTNNLPVPKPIKSIDRQLEALRRLKVKPESLAKAPQISQLLKTAKGGLKAVLTAMRFVQDDEVIAAFLSRYDSIPIGDRKYIPWEAICIASGVNLNHLYGSASLAYATYCGNKSRMLVVGNHPDITKARIKFGKELVGAEKDRTALDMMVGALPSPKGPTFIGKAIFGASGGQNKTTGNDDDDTQEGEMLGVEDDINQLFPSSNVMQEKIVMIKQKMLTEG